MVRNRTGRPYLYLEKHRGTERAQKRQRLPDDPRSPEFWAEYARLMQLPAPREKTDTVSCLIDKWQASTEWSQMREKTREEWSRYCGRIRDAWGPLEVKGIEPPLSLVPDDCNPAFLFHAIHKHQSAIPGDCVRRSVPRAAFRGRSMLHHRCDYSQRFYKIIVGRPKFPIHRIKERRRHIKHIVAVAILPER
jgi:hypothetical protein